MIMERSRELSPLRRGAAILALATVLGAGCGVDKQTPPSLSGPSGFAYSLIVTAAPQILARDGSSMSTISIIARNPDGTPMANRRLLVSASSGTLLSSEVNTASDGRASVLYIAPGPNVPVSAVEILVVPVEVGDRVNTHTTSLVIEVRGPEVPVASFSFTPASAAVLESVTFDGSGSQLNGSACGSACTYSWNFDDGSTATGIAVQHTFSNPGVFNVTLTVTSQADGTSSSATRPVIIAPPAAPVAGFTSGACAVPAARCVRFNDASTVGNGATITGYLIDFGDNANAATMPAERTYAAAGTYNVRLTVTDSLGRTNTITRPVVVP
jgi:PKD repeat protein